MNDSRVASAFERIRKEAGDSKQADLHRKRALELCAGLFRQQLDLIRDPARFKVGLCTRRAGKSTTAIRYMLVLALEHDGSNIQYIALTGKKARKEIWPDLKRVCRAYDVPALFNEVTLTCRIGNSTINLDGCDNAGDVEKYRGSDGGYDLVIIDESKSYEPNMFRELVYDVIGPALADRMGALLIIGTPGRTLAGPFYEITNVHATTISKKDDSILHATSRPYAERDDSTWQGVDFEWSFHRWYTKDNVAKPHIWLEQLATKKRNQWTDEDPVWRREYQGEWVADDTGYVYRYAQGRNDWHVDEQSANEWGLPADHEWRLLLGCDLGYDDDFAIVVCAWSETSPDFYFIDEFSRAGLVPDQWVEKIKEFQEKYGSFDVMVGDRGALGKAILANMEQRDGLTIEPADKHEKRDYQELLNSDLLSGRAKVKKGMKLARQMASLQWKPDGKTEDKESSPKDLCDAALYVWRYCYHHYSKPKQTPRHKQEAESIREREADRRRKLGQEMTRRSYMDPEERRLDTIDGGNEWRSLDDDDMGDWHR